jgi:hypothetical protein
MYTNLFKQTVQSMLYKGQSPTEQGIKLCQSTLINNLELMMDLYKLYEGKYDHQATVFEFFIKQLELSQRGQGLEEMDRKLININEEENLLRFMDQAIDKMLLPVYTTSARSSIFKTFHNFFSNDPNIFFSNLSLTFYVKTSDMITKDTKESASYQKDFKKLLISYKSRDEMIGQNSVFNAFI